MDQKDRRKNDGVRPLGRKEGVHIYRQGVLRGGEKGIIYLKARDKKKDSSPGGGEENALDLSVWGIWEREKKKKDRQ